ncbi:MAG: M48 family metalloprotease [Planctomycetota bacterium]
MLLPLICLIVAVEGVGWRLFDEAGVYSPALPPALGMAPLGYLTVWGTYLFILGILTTLCSRIPRWRHPAFVASLHLLSCGMYLWFLPGGQWFPDYLWSRGLTWRFLWEMTTLAPYLAGELLILRRPGWPPPHRPWLHCLRHLGFMLLPYLMGQLLYEGACQLAGDALSWPPLSFPVSLALMSIIVLLMPSAARLMIPTRPMEAGPLREMFSSQMSGLGISFNNILLWNAGPTQANAAVLGMLPPLRFLLVTKPLLDAFDDEELRLILWHELGHVFHRHLWIYYIFFMATGGASVLAYEAFSMHPTWWVSLGTILAWAMLFSFLSRNLERQADLFALSREKKRGDYARVLLKLSEVSGIPEGFRSLTHGSIRSRVMALESLGSSAHKAFRFHRRIRILVFACLLLLAVETSWWLFHHAKEFMTIWAS